MSKKSIELSVADIDFTEADESSPESELIDVIVKFSQREIEFDDCEKVLQSIYCLPGGQHYRHKYSNIAVLINSRQDAKEYLEETCYKLSEKLRKSPNKKSKSIAESLGKLADHIALELFREEIDSKRTKSIIDLKRDADEITRDLKDAKTKLDKSEMGYVATLSLFSGIMMAFAGVFTISSTAFENINEAPLYKILFLITLLGVVLVNGVYAIFFCVSRLLNRSFLNRCYTTRREQCDGCSSDCKSVKRWLKYNHIVVFINIFFLLLILGSLCMWVVTTYFIK